MSYLFDNSPLGVGAYNQPTQDRAIPERGPSYADQSRRASNADPITSHMAAAEAEQFASRHEGLIVAALRVAARPLTHNEIARASGLTVQVHRRLRHMERAGLIRCQGERKCDVSKRLCETWEAK